MDGDALGSLGALYLILKKMWKDVRATNDETIPESFHFLWNTEIVDKDLEIETFKPDIIISLDAASTDQLWITYKEYIAMFDTTPFIVIDHHITNKWFWELNIIDVKASITCELLYAIFWTLWFKMYFYS